MEKSDWRFASAARQRPHMLLQPCRRCAASVLKRNWPSWFFAGNFLHDCFEARVAAQRIEERVGFDELKVGGAAVTNSLFQPIQHPIFISKSEIGQGKCVRLHIPRSGSVNELNQ